MSRDLLKLISEKFTSGNSVEVERITITRAEYEQELAKPEQNLSIEAMNEAWYLESQKNPHTAFNSWCRGYEAAIKLAKPEPAAEKSDLERDAASLLFALNSAWPYVHDRCTINSVKNPIIALMRKHSDFLDLHSTKQVEVHDQHYEQVLDPVVYRPRDKNK